MLKILLEDPKVIVKRLFKDELGNPLVLTNYQNDQLRQLMRSLQNERRVKFIFVQATRSGKSELISVFIALCMILLDNEKIANISYTKDQSAIIFERTKAHVVEDNETIAQLVDFGRSMRTRREFSKTRMFMKNGTQFRIFSTGVGETEFTAESLLGFGASILILDESGSIKDIVYRQKIKRMIADARRPIFLIESGTPRKRNHFYDSWNNETYIKFHVNWKMAVDEGQMDLATVEEAKEENPATVFQMWYEAEFPEQMEDQLFSKRAIDNMKAALTEEEKKLLKEKPHEKRLGVDVARFGKNFTVLYKAIKYYETWFLTESKRFERLSTMQTTSQIIKWDREEDFDLIQIDDTGLGGGVTDRLKELDISEKVYPFVAGEKPWKSKKLSKKKEEENKRNLNKKAYAYKNFESKATKGLVRIIDPENKDRLLNELRKIRYEYLSDGTTLKIIDPEDKSPDFADAANIALYTGKVFAFGFA